MLAVINVLLVLLCLAAEMVPVLADLAARRERELFQASSSKDQRQGEG